MDEKFVLLLKTLFKEVFMQFPKKINTQSVGLALAQLEGIAKEADPKAVPVMRVWGMVHAKTPGVSQFGSYIKFSGEFGALNLVNGEEFRSQNLLLPQVGEAVVNSLFERAAKDGGVAEVGLDVCVEFNNSAKGGTKFRYVVKPIVEFKGDDALSVMAKRLPPPQYPGENGKKSKK